jgi:hypothetical protein
VASSDLTTPAVVEPFVSEEKLGELGELHSISL